MNRTIVGQLQNPLTRERDQVDRARVLLSFPVLGRETEQHALVLRRYLDNRPEKFFDRALLFLRELNLEEWHDSLLNTGDDYDLIRMIDKHVHPAYLRLVEGVFTPLLRPVAHFSRLHRNRGVEGLDVWSINEELKGQKEEHLVRPYQHTVRNGIAHGGISFLQREIRYRDHRGNEETFAWTLRNSSGVSKGIDKPVVQSGRDFPYIKVGGGQ